MCLNFIGIYSQFNDIGLDNKCHNYIYSVFIHVFLEISIFIGIYCNFYFSSTGLYLFNLYFYCIYWSCFYQVWFLFYIYIFIHIYWITVSFLNTCAIKFIEGKFYFEGRACYIGKIMPTCIE